MSEEQITLSLYVAQTSNLNNQIGTVQRLLQAIPQIQIENASINVVVCSQLAHLSYWRQAESAFYSIGLRVVSENTPPDMNNTNHFILYCPPPCEVNIASIPALVKTLINTQSYATYGAILTYDDNVYNNEPLHSKMLHRLHPMALYRAVVLDDLSLLDRHFLLHLHLYKREIIFTPLVVGKVYSEFAEQYPPQYLQDIITQADPITVCQRYHPTIGYI